MNGDQSWSVIGSRTLLERRLAGSEPTLENEAILGREPEILSWSILV